jgi:hypothetical protein
MSNGLKETKNETVVACFKHRLRKPVTSWGRDLNPGTPKFETRLTNHSTITCNMLSMSNELREMKNETVVACFKHRYTYISPLSCIE